MFGLDDVGNPPVDHGAGVDDVRPPPLDLLGELDVGDDEAEVVSGLHQEADAGVAEDGPQDWLHYGHELLAGELVLGDRPPEQRRQRQPRHVRQQQPHNQAEVDRRDRVQRLAFDGNVQQDRRHRQHQGPDDHRQGDPRPIGPNPGGLAYSKHDHRQPDEHRQEHAAKDEKSHDCRLSQITMNDAMSQPPPRSKPHSKTSDSAAEARPPTLGPKKRIEAAERGESTQRRVSRQNAKRVAAGLARRWVNEGFQGKAFSQTASSKHGHYCLIDPYIRQIPPTFRDFSPDTRPNTSREPPLTAPSESRATRLAPIGP